MKNLVVLAGLIGAASTGCTSGDAHVGATWTIKSVVSNSELGCPQGFDTAALYNQELDANGSPIGSPIIDLFDCAAGAGTSAPLPPSTYATHVEITDHTNATVYAKSVPAYLDVRSVDLTYNADILDDGGYFQFAWDLVGAASNRPLDCASAGVTGASSGIESVVTVTNGTMMKTDQFTCEDGFGVTAAFAAGSYTVSVDAFTSAGAIGTAPTLTNKIIKDRAASADEVTDLGTVTIPIDGQ